MFYESGSSSVRSIYLGLLYVLVELILSSLYNDFHLFSFLFFFYYCWFKVSFIWYNSYSCSLLVSICVGYFFPPLYLESYEDICKSVSWRQQIFELCFFLSMPPNYLFWVGHVNHLHSKFILICEILFQSSYCFLPSCFVFSIGLLFYKSWVFLLLNVSILVSIDLSFQCLELLWPLLVRPVYWWQIPLAYACLGKILFLLYSWNLVLQYTKFVSNSYSV